MTTIKKARGKSRAAALRGQRRAAGLCASCAAPAKGYYCKKHRRARRHVRRRAARCLKPGRFLGLHSPQGKRRRLVIGYGFSVGGAVIAYPRDGGIGVKRSDARTSIELRRTTTGMQFVWVALSDFPEDRYPTRKYPARQRGFWIIGSAEPVPHGARPASVAAHGGVDPVGSARDW